MSPFARALLYVFLLWVALGLLILLAACGPRNAWHPAPSSSITALSPQPSLPVARLGDPCRRPGANARTASGSTLLCVLREGDDHPRWRMQ